MSFTVTPAAIRKTLWSKEIWSQSMYQSALGHFLKSDIVYRPKEFASKGVRGQSLVYTYVGKLLQPGLGAGSTMAGNEEALNIGSFSMQVDVMRLAVKNPNDEDTIEALQVDFNFTNETKRLLADAVAEKLDYSVFNQLAGVNYTSVTLGGITYSTSGTGYSNITNVFGQNTIVAASTDRIIRAGNVANDQSLTSSNKMTLSLVDAARELLMNSNQQVGYLSNGMLGELWISAEQEYDLRQDTDSPVTWYNNALAKAAGGDASELEGPKFYKNRILPVGTYGGVEIYVHPRVAYGINSSTSAAITTVRRAVLVGKNALSYASTKGLGYADDGDVPFTFHERLEDYDYWKGIEARTIYGVKKNTPSIGSDVGVVVIATYAAGHTS